MERPQTESLIGDVGAATLSNYPEHPLTEGWRGFARRNRNAIGAFLMFLLFWVIFVFTTSGVFLRPEAYTSIFTQLPITILLATAVVFTTTNGAIDLSYPSSIGLGAWAFAFFTSKAWNGEIPIPPQAGPWVGLIAAILMGLLIGFLNSILVLRFRLTPLIATLGMNFFVRGLVDIVSNQQSIPVPFMPDTNFYQICCANTFFGLPNQFFWGLLFAGFTWLLYSKHTIGKHTRIVGDNEESAREMGIPIGRVKAFSYIYTAIAAALAGVLTVSILVTFWPDTGTNALLPVLTAIFVGGNPLVGGMGTVAGALIGSLTVGFINTGLIAMGITDVYTGFVYGIVLIISLLGFRNTRRA